jgi:O-methyltransferase
MKFFKTYIKRYVSFINSIDKKKDKNLNEIISYNLNEIRKFNEKEIGDLQNILKDLMGTSLVESLKILDSLNMTMKIEGDVCEFGVAQGKTSKLIAYFIKETNKKLYLIDSFQGLPEPSEKDQLKDDIFNLGNMKKYQGKMSHPENKVINELNSINFNNNQLIINKGFFNKETKNNMNLPKKVSFAYLDFDFYQPTLDVLNYLTDVLSVGGVIIVDDYDFFSTGVKTSVEEWFSLNSKSYIKKIIKTNCASFVVLKKTN